MRTSTRLSRAETILLSAGDLLAELQGRGARAVIVLAVCAHEEGSRKASRCRPDDRVPASTCDSLGSGVPAVATRSASRLNSGSEFGPQLPVAHDEAGPKKPVKGLPHNIRFSEHALGDLSEHTGNRSEQDGRTYGRQLAFAYSLLAASNGI